MRSLVASSLRQDGHSVVEVRDGHELLEVISLAELKEDPPFDLLISDVRMPKLNGLSALFRLRREFPDLAIVLMTAFGDEKLHTQAQRHGAEAMLDKPFDLDDLRVAILNLPELIRQRRRRVA